MAVYDVLRDANRRMRYNDVLKNGLPDWRQAVYYYRRVRKMGLTEMSVILFVLVTVGQYIVSWAAYLEKKYTAVSLLKIYILKFSELFLYYFTRFISRETHQHEIFILQSLALLPVQTFIRKLQTGVLNPPSSISLLAYHPTPRRHYL